MEENAENEDGVTLKKYHVPAIKFLGKKPWERGQFQFRTQVIGLSLNALDKNINANLQNAFNLPAALTRG